MKFFTKWSNYLLNDQVLYWIVKFFINWSSSLPNDQIMFLLLHLFSPREAAWTSHNCSYSFVFIVALTIHDIEFHGLLVISIVICWYLLTLCTYSLFFNWFLLIIIDLCIVLYWKYRVFNFLLIFIHFSYIL